MPGFEAQAASLRRTAFTALKVRNTVTGLSGGVLFRAASAASSPRGEGNSSAPPLQGRKLMFLHDNGPAFGADIMAAQFIVFQIAEAFVRELGVAGLAAYARAVLPRHLEAHLVDEVAAEEGPCAADRGAGRMDGTAPPFLEEHTEAVIPDFQRGLAAHHLGIAGQHFFPGKAEVYRKARQVARPDNDAAAPFTAFAASLAGEGLGLVPEELFVHRFDAEVFHYLDPGLEHQFAGFGAPYAFLHPEDFRHLGKLEHFAGMAFAVHGIPEQADDIRLEAPFRQFGDIVRRGKPPRRIPHNMDGHHVETGVDQIAAHTIRRGTDIVLGADDGNTAHPAQQVTKLIGKKHENSRILSRDKSTLALPAAFCNGLKLLLQEKPPLSKKKPGDTGLY